MVFFLPNMTWLQPPAHVHQMITSSWLPRALNVSMVGSCDGLSVSAQSSSTFSSSSLEGPEGQGPEGPDAQVNEEEIGGGAMSVLSSSDIAMRVVNLNPTAVKIMLLGPVSSPSSSSSSLSSSSSSSSSSSPPSPLSSVEVNTLASPSVPHAGWDVEANTPSDPSKIAPYKSTWTRAANGAASTLTLPAGSFSVLTYKST